MLELGPVLPYSSGAEGTVVVKNPCEFPIEFYSLEFDQQYLAEEQVRRSAPRLCAAMASWHFNSWRQSPLVAFQGQPALLAGFGGS